MCACLSNLALSDENKLEIVKCGAIPALISLAQSQDMQVCKRKCEVWTEDRYCSYASGFVVDPCGVHFDGT